MTSDAIYQDKRVDYHLQAPNNYPVIPAKLSAAEMLTYEERVFSIVSENTGKLAFLNLLELVGGLPHKQVLYKVLASLARQGRIVRIRGIGKKRIEFFYHDTAKLKKPTLSASVSFVPP
jgi:hypothetical protein